MIHSGNSRSPAELRPSAPGGSDPSPAWYKQTRWQVAGFLACAAALNYGDRAAISSVYPALRTEFALSDRQIGLLGAVFLWSYALASPLAGLVADRWSRRAAVVLSLALWSAVTLVTGFAGGLVTLVVLRCALGLVESLYLPGATALIADHHPSATRGRAMSVHSVGLNFGVVLGGTFAGYLAQHYGWRSGFWVLGSGGILLALLARFFLAPSPTAPAAASAAPAASFLEALAYFARVRTFHILLGKAMLAGVGIWIFLNWLPLYFRETFNLTLAAAGFAGTFMLQISSVLGLAFGGWLSDRAAHRDARRRLLVHAVCYFAAAPFPLLFLLQPSFALVAVAVSFFSLFRTLGQSSENPLVCEVIPARYRSSAIGIMNTGATAAGGLGVLLAGILKSHFGLNAVFAGISLLFVIAASALVFAYRHWADADIARAREFTARPISP